MSELFEFQEERSPVLEGVLHRQSHPSDLLLHRYCHSGRAHRHAHFRLRQTALVSSVYRYHQIVFILLKSYLNIYRFRPILAFMKIYDSDSDALPNSPHDDHPSFPFPLPSNPITHISSTTLPHSFTYTKYRIQQK